MHTERVLLHVLSLTLADWVHEMAQEPPRTANELIWRTNYLGNKRRGDRKVEDGVLENFKKGREQKRKKKCILQGTG